MKRKKIILPVQIGMPADGRSELMIDKLQITTPLQQEHRGYAGIFLKGESLLCSFHIGGWVTHSYAGFLAASKEPWVTFWGSSFPFSYPW
jgi:hypothetical protein